MRAHGPAGPRAEWNDNAPKARSMAQAVELLVFELDDQRYALTLSSVREVVRAVLLTHLPGAPAIVEGAIIVRGRIVPVFDLRARFGLPPRRLHPDQHLILAWAGERLVAIRADRVSGFVEIAPTEIEAAAQLSPTLRQIAGVAKVDDGLILIHDLETFLTAAEAQALEGALAAEPLVEAVPTGGAPGGGTPGRGAPVGGAPAGDTTGGEGGS